MKSRLDKIEIEALTSQVLREVPAATDKGKSVSFVELEPTSNFPGESIDPGLLKEASPASPSVSTIKSLSQ